MNVKCYQCKTNDVGSCDGVPLRVGKKYFCSQECMRDYLIEEVEKFENKGWV
jgi:hypothetical protein